MIERWTDERVARMRELHAEGHPFSKIARMLGGVTRNAVIGKAARLGLQARADRSRENAHQRRKIKARNTRPKVVKLVLVKPAQPAPEPVVVKDAPVGGVALVDLRPGQCRFPLDMPRDANPIPGMYCGGSVKPHRPYCTAHCARAYTPRRTKAEILGSTKLAPGNQRFAFGA